ncbi:MAG: DTW domain-containing protein [Pseudomonadota bacterium]|uniref:tRNA-uridine aminocarboxypropyltransferase n=1 Tax=Polaromonas sp. TaxID=1869339 RepID=UPI001826D7BC|nr:tRNA-uridine aminocarboxypropyltransferase [Polaromonas sp.]MBA3593313.1 DTW domain-containing protein [Polaromonas sp.]MDQ3271902.1 DTW domain-containing protein [Pseudomonadota bacterium]
MTGRLHCAACLRPQSSCICRWITPVAYRVEVLILQHPLEADNPKGTARLLHLSLPSSRLIAGEVFAAQEWQPPGNTRHNLLLYPDLPSDRSAGLPLPPEPAPELLQDPSGLRLIVLDGTWRKSRKLLYLNPSLQRLPRLALRDVQPSNYRLRRARQPDQLSTLEAVCAALAQVEGDEGQFQPLLNAFDGFVAQQMAFLGRAAAA